LKHTFRQFDLNLLRVFAALAAEGNVTRAALRLGLSQSAVSNALNRLRQSVGDALFEKTASGVRPTPRAREMWSAIQPHFQAMEQAISPETFDPGAYSGTLTVAMSDYSAERILPRLMQYLSGHAPAMRIDLAPYGVANLPEAFDRRGVDMAIGGYVNDESPSNGIRMRELWPVHWSCLMRRSNPLAKGSLTLERFLSAQHLDVRCPDMQVPVYDSLLATRGHVRNLLLTLNAYTPALAIIGQSDFIGVLPTTLLDLTIYGKQLVSRPPPVRMPVRPYGVIWHRRLDNKPAHRWLRHAIISLFPNPPTPKPT
jgi:DNA-binding transcriptional LysR family regulator